MNTKKNLLGLAVLTTSLALAGCGGSSSSGNQQVEEDMTPDEPTFPAAFAFSQNPATALDEMKELPEKAFPAELYNLLRQQLIEGGTASSTDRLSFWIDTKDAFTNYQCGVGTFGALATQPDPAVGTPANSFQVSSKDTANNEEELGAYPDGVGTAALFREVALLIFNDCELVDPADSSTVVATINGQVALIREWVGESSNGDMGNSRIIMDNFHFNFGTSGLEAREPVVVTKGNTTYSLAFGFTETHVFGEFSQAQQNALSNFEYAQPFRSRLFQQRLADNDFKGMYAFDAANLSITTTPNGGTASQVQFNNFASVFVAPTELGNNTPDDIYKLYVESPYRGDENAEASSIVFGSDEDAETVFIETLSNGGNDKFITADFEFVGDEASFLRGRSDQARLDCPTSATIGYSSTPSAPMVAGISFLLDGNSQETTRVYVDENNTQTNRDPAVAISTASEDNVCRDGENGPTRFIPLPGLGPISYDPSVVI
ncbi:MULTISPECIES: hypothetical protein [Marinobacter]|uniref:Lipoprotein n=1 Tax=Marinobacter alkaliphilus TaxID=254719 RepID=A0ABZ3E436_9GAMM|nr:MULTISPECIES: hypothetical protein [unclassified Marinobacter]QFS85683.1 hypothetical protein FIV08_02360 [Marinobacter sp. THAF197a]QFT49477.1 hypothetical protein FIU96_02360 [Marinobacter sp. THAF39]